MDESNNKEINTESNISNKQICLEGIFKSREIKADNFEDNLNISDIKDEIEKIEINNDYLPENDKCLKIYTNQSLDKDFSEDLDDINEDEFNQRKISICSIQSEEFNDNDNDIKINLNNLKNKKNDLKNKKILKKLSKEDLNNIPLPVFSCIFCSNDTIAFKHLLQENITNKYLFQTSIYDIRDINKLLIYQPIIDKDDKNEKLLDIIIKNTEYINANYNKENIINFYKSKNYSYLCNQEYKNICKFFVQRIEESIVKKKKDFYFKGINKIPLNSLNNRCLFNSTNSLINNYNALSGFVEPIAINNNINISKNNNINNSNISINFNSISLNNNETGNNICKDNNNLLISIVEHNNIEKTNEIDDKEEIIDIFGFDMEKKKSKENIIWENKYYDIWNPIISDIEDEEFNENISNIKVNDYSHKEYNEEFSEKRYRLKVNLLKSKTSNNSFNFHLNKKTSTSHIKSMASTNSSSLINCDNENKIKSSIFSYSKDFNNKSKNRIHVNTIHMKNNSNQIKYNKSMIISNKKDSLKSKNDSYEFRKFINNSNLLNTIKGKSRVKKNIINKNNNMNSNSYSMNINNTSISNSDNISNLDSIRYKKNKINKNENNRIREKSQEKLFNNNKKLNEIKRRINHYKNSKSYFYQNSINQTIKESKLINTSSTNSILLKEGTKISYFKENTHNNEKIFIKNKNPSQKNKNYANYATNKLSHLSFSKTNEKANLERIREKISEINKIINNNKNFKINNYHSNNKTNSILYSNYQKDRNNIIKTKFKSGMRASNININKKLNISDVNKNKKLLLSNSFIYSKIKFEEKNNSNKYIFLKK